MKIKITILTCLLMTNCSSVSNDLSKIKSSFKNLIVFNKQIDSRSTRVPIGNQKFLNNSAVNSKNNIESKSNNIKVETINTELIENKKINDDLHIDNNQLDHYKDPSIKKRESIMKKMFKTSKTSKQHIPEAGYKDQTIIESDQSINIDNSQKKFSDTSNQSEDNDNNKKPIDDKAPKLLKDLDETGLYIKPSNVNTRPKLLPNSRY